MPTDRSLGKPFELLSAGVDYATFTVSTGPRALAMYAKGKQVLEQEHLSGNGEKPWRSFGYLGSASKHITVGRRLDGCIVRLSGGVAHTWWRTFFTMCDKCTRLDLAVTGHTDATSFNVAHLAQREARAWKRQHDSRITVGFQFQDPGGATCTLGARSSEKYGRIYDKWAESGSPYSPGDWRWEVEYKGDTAYALASDLFSENTLAGRVGGLTMAFFAERGLTVPFAVAGVQWRYKAIQEPITAERRLEWLHTNVRPFVRELALEVGEKPVLDALGLWPDNRTDGQQLELAAVGESNGGS